MPPRWYVGFVAIKRLLARGLFFPPTLYEYFILLDIDIDHYEIPIIVIFSCFNDHFRSRFFLLFHENKYVKINFNLLLNGRIKNTIFSDDILINNFLSIKKSFLRLIKKNYE